MTRQRAPAKLHRPKSVRVVKTMSVAGITFQFRLQTCGKPSCRKGCNSDPVVPRHGPYWYAIAWNPDTGKSKTVYVGKQEPSLTIVTQLMKDKKK